MNDNDILINLQSSIRQALAEAANEEIEKQKHKFECEMGKIKSNIIAKLVNAIEIRAKHDLDGRYTIQIVLKKE